MGNSLSDKVPSRSKPRDTLQMGFSADSRIFKADVEPKQYYRQTGGTEELSLSGYGLRVRQWARWHSCSDLVISRLYM